MTPDERLEAAARAAWEWQEAPRISWDGLGEHSKTLLLAKAKVTLAAAYPELSAGTHWLAPMEMTEGMVRAVDDADSATSLFLYPENAWIAARDAYLKEGGNGG